MMWIMCLGGLGVMGISGMISDRQTGFNFKVFLGLRVLEQRISIEIELKHICYIIIYIYVYPDLKASKPSLPSPLRKKTCLDS